MKKSILLFAMILLPAVGFAQSGQTEGLYSIGHLPQGVLIVQGSSGWAKKIVK
jgi:hypothetical protein